MFTKLKNILSTTITTGGPTHYMSNGPFGPSFSGGSGFHSFSLLEGIILRFLMSVGLSVIIYFLISSDNATGIFVILILVLAFYVLKSVVLFIYYIYKVLNLLIKKY